jgi:hypothetical protein
MLLYGKTGITNQLPVILTQPVKLLFGQLKLPVAFFKHRKHRIVVHHSFQHYCIAVGQLIFKPEDIENTTFHRSLFKYHFLLQGIG